jgi:hypothetical protein
MLGLSSINIHIHDSSDIKYIISKIEEGRKEVEKIEKEVRLKNCDNVTILIGSTGAGKSTLGNLLVSHQLIVKRDEYKRLVIEGGKGIENSANSATSLPNLFFDKEKNSIYLDFPGFKDNRGADIDILNSYYARQLFNTDFKKKVILVINEIDLFEPRIEKLITTMNCVYDLLGDCNKYFEGFLVVITFAERSLDLIKKRIENDITGKNLDFQNGKKLIEEITKNFNSKVCIFPKPSKEGILDANGTKSNIDNLLRKVKFVSNLKSNSSCISSESRKKVGQMWVHIKSLILNILNKTNSKIRDNLMKSTNSNLTVENLAVLRENLDRLKQDSNLIGNSSKNRVEIITVLNKFINENIQNDMDKEEIIKEIETHYNYFTFCNDANPDLNADFPVNELIISLKNLYDEVTNIFNTKVKTLNATINKDLDQHIDLFVQEIFKAIKNSNDLEISDSIKFFKEFKLKICDRLKSASMLNPEDHLRSFGEILKTFETSIINVYFKNYNSLKTRFNTIKNTYNELKRLQSIYTNILPFSISKINGKFEILGKEYITYLYKEANNEIKNINNIMNKINIKLVNVFKEKSYSLPEVNLLFFNEAEKELKNIQNYFNEIDRLSLVRENRVQNLNSFFFDELIRKLHEEQAQNDQNKNIIIKSLYCIDIINSKILKDNNDNNNLKNIKNSFQTIFKIREENPDFSLDTLDVQVLNESIIQILNKNEIISNCKKELMNLHIDGEIRKLLGLINELNESLKKNIFSQKLETIDFSLKEIDKQTRNFINFITSDYLDNNFPNLLNDKGSKLRNIRELIKNVIEKTPKSELVSKKQVIENISTTFWTNIQTMKNLRDYIKNILESIEELKVYFLKSVNNYKNEGQSRKINSNIFKDSEINDGLLNIDSDKLTNYLDIIISKNTFLNNLKNNKEIYSSKLIDFCSIHDLNLPSNENINVYLGFFLEFSRHFYSNINQSEKGLPKRLTSIKNYSFSLKDLPLEILKEGLDNFKKDIEEIKYQEIEEILIRSYLYKTKIVYIEKLENLIQHVRGDSSPNFMGIINLNRNSETNLYTIQGNVSTVFHSLKELNEIKIKYFPSGKCIAFCDKLTKEILGFRTILITEINKLGDEFLLKEIKTAVNLLKNYFDSLKDYIKTNFNSLNDLSKENFKKVDEIFDIFSKDKKDYETYHNHFFSDTNYIFKKEAKLRILLKCFELFDKSEFFNNGFIKDYKNLISNISMIDYESNKITFNDIEKEFLTLDHVRLRKELKEKLKNLLKVKIGTFSPAVEKSFTNIYNYISIRINKGLMKNIYKKVKNIRDYETWNNSMKDFNNIKINEYLSELDNTYFNIKTEMEYYEFLDEIQVIETEARLISSYNHLILEFMLSKLKSHLQIPLKQVYDSYACCFCCFCCYPCCLCCEKIKNLFK